MTHLYKLPLDTVDIFVVSIDTDNKTITFEVRDKETGLLTNKRHTAPYDIIDSMVVFESFSISLVAFLQMAVALLSGAKLTAQMSPPPTVEV